MWEAQLHIAFAGYDAQYKQGNVLDPYVVHVDERHTLTYNGSHYMFIIPRHEMLPYCAASIKLIAETPTMCAWILEHDYLTHAQGKK